MVGGSSADWNTFQLRLERNGLKLFLKSSKLASRQDVRPQPTEQMEMLDYFQKLCIDFHRLYTFLAETIPKSVNYNLEKDLK